MERLSVKEFLSFSNHYPVLDVRSPGEYAHAHIPGAYNLPLFSDEERKQVGTTYKQESRQAAIKIGLDMFGKKMRTMVEEVEALCKNFLPATAGPGRVDSDPSKAQRTVLIHCWRGGMRSNAVAWLLDLYGFRVYLLTGGYKAYRNHVLQSFEKPYPVRILGGYTGSGKTEVLQQMARDGEKVIDLEQIACHMGSAFGSYRMPPQPTQEMFENLLSHQLETLTGSLSSLEEKAAEAGPVWMEDESQRIGNLNIPNALWKTMRSAPILFLDVAFEKRLNHLVAEYEDCDTEKLKEAVERISKRLGPVETKTTIGHLEEGNRLEAFRILLQYYDKRYSKGLHNRENLSDLLERIECAEVNAGNARLLSKYQSV